MRRKACLFVQGTQSLCRYVVAEQATPLPRVLAMGSFEAEDRHSLEEQLRRHASSGNVRCRRAVLLLPRADLDISTLTLPPATDAELPQLVTSAMALASDDAAGTRASDFLVVQQEAASCETLVFSADSHMLHELTASFRSSGLDLLGITYSGLGSLEVLKRSTQHPAPLSIVLGTTDHDIDVAVVEDGRPLLFRSIPCSSADEQLLADQLAAEIRRTLAVTQRPDDDTRLYLLGDRHEHERLAQSLAEQLSLSVSLINPMDRVRSSGDIEHPSRYANLIGAAAAWNEGGLKLDLLHPRQPPRPPGLRRRLTVWGAVAAVVMLALGWVVVRDRADQLQAIQQKQLTLEKLQKRAGKAAALKGTAEAVQAWQQDDFAWLDELRDLSERLPDQDQVVIRRMNMSTASQQGVLDLAVQVREPDVITRLEDAVRDYRHSVSSKRVTESDAKARLPWAFETRIVLKPGPLPQLPGTRDTPIQMDDPRQAADGSASNSGGDEKEGAQK